AAVYRSGETVWTDAVGIAEEGRDATIDDQYRIGSITKPFPAAAVMLLVEDGHVALDDPLERHLPEARFGDLTVRRLRAHSSGLQPQPPGDGWDARRDPGRRRASCARRAGAGAARRGSNASAPRSSSCRRASAGITPTSPTP